MPKAARMRHKRNCGNRPCQPSPRGGRGDRKHADAVAGEAVGEVVAGVEFKKLSKIKNFYHLFHRFTSFAVPLPLCRGRWCACVQKVKMTFQTAYFKVVPALPCSASTALSRLVMMALRPGLDSTNLMAASTLGSMEPGAK